MNEDESLEAKKLTLDDQIKIAEKEKFLAETKKLQTEQLKSQIELDELIKETQKKWFLKKEFAYNISKWAVGISFVLFFINYVVIPAANKDNIELSTKNAITNDSLYRREKALKENSAVLKKEQYKLFQASKSVHLMAINLAIKQNELKRIDSLYKVLFKLYSDNKIATNKQIKDTKKQLNQRIQAYSQNPKYSLLSYIGTTGLAGVNPSAYPTLPDIKFISVYISFYYNNTFIPIINGKIYDIDGTSLPFVTVENPKINWRVILPPGTYKIEISDSKYEVINKEFIIKDIDSTEFMKNVKIKLDLKK